MTWEEARKRTTMNTWPPASSLSVSAHQREQYALAAQDNLAILGGRPGSGKTYVLARILGKVSQDPKVTAVAAPTGKAAVRVTETLNKAGVRGRATTIHRLLGALPANDGTWGFAHDEKNPLPHSQIFIDESSMVDTPLLSKLMAARAPGCKVMLIGDVNQLAPVGHGAPLRDLIAAGLPYGELREIHRNSGRVVKACHAIIDERKYIPSEKLDLLAESAENLLHIERGSPGTQIDTLKGMLKRFGSEPVKVRDEDGDIVERRFDPVWDVQVIVPVNDKSPLARIALNNILQNELNPGGDRISGNPFRKFDKIACTQNGRMPVEDRRNIPPHLRGVPLNEDADDEGKIYCANGELARVEAIFPRYTVARLWAPDRLIRIPHGARYVNEEGETEDAGCNWCLAYAISAHKSQGAEWPIVITMVDAYPGATRLCTREWIYTALSRGKVAVFTVGQRALVDDMCRKSGLWSRKTFLKEQIEDLQFADLLRPEAESESNHEAVEALL